MSNEQKTHIDRLKEILQKNGNIIKIRYDRELISVDSDGNVQNIDACTWADGGTDTFTLNKRIFPNV